MEPVDGYILAGGKSSRFGSDKARAELDGRSLLLRQIDATELVCARVTVVVDRIGRYADLDVREIADRRPGGGPMSGLDAALHDSTTEWLLVLSCDLTHFDPAWLDDLLKSRSAEADAAAFHHNDRWEPLCAIYHRRLISVVDERLRSGDRSLQDLLNSVAATKRPMPSNWPSVAQVNTPDDLDRARAR
ncbi:MAG: molybdenum cofactor guanylyltransferase [Phycisphaerales bacterium]